MTGTDRITRHHEPYERCIPREILLTTLGPRDTLFTGRRPDFVTSRLLDAHGHEFVLTRKAYVHKTASRCCSDLFLPWRRPSFLSLTPSHSLPFPCTLRPVRPRVAPPFCTRPVICIYCFELRGPQHPLRMSIMPEFSLTRGHELATRSASDDGLHHGKCHLPSAFYDPHDYSRLTGDHLRPTIRSSSL
jgi:hypothetical protein